MSPRRRTIAAIVVAIGAIIYGLSPIDIIPELFTGPLGFTDDIAVLIGAGIGVWKLLSGRGKEDEDGSVPPAATP